MTYPPIIASEAEATWFRQEFKRIVSKFNGEKATLPQFQEAWSDLYNLMRDNQGGLALLQQLAIYKERFGELK